MKHFYLQTEALFEGRESESTLTEASWSSAPLLLSASSLHRLSWCSTAAMKKCRIDFLSFYHVISSLSTYTAVQGTVTFLETDKTSSHLKEPFRNRAASSFSCNHSVELWTCYLSQRWLWLWAHTINYGNLQSSGDQTESLVAWSLFIGQKPAQYYNIYKKSRNCETKIKMFLFSKFPIWEKKERKKCWN